MLSHVNKRVRGHDQIKLPLDALLDLYLSDSSAPLVKNFAVVYVEMAMDRSLQEQQTAAVGFSLPLALPLQYIHQSLTGLHLAVRHVPFV